MDLASGMSAAEKQRRIAEELRKRAMDPIPEGQMVGRHYVAPSWTQQIAPLVNAGLSIYAGNKATAAENASNQAISQAKQQWQSSLPQAVAQQTQPFMGPMPDGGEAPPLVTQEAQPLTTGRILKHTLAGMDIPGNEKAAALYNQGALADLAREDTQQARKEEHAANAVAAAQKQQADLEWKREQLAAQMEDKSLGRESREAMNKSLLALNAQIAAAKDATDRARIDMQRELGQARIAVQRDKAAAGATPKPVSTTVMKELGSLENQAIGVSNMSSSFKPEYGGAGGYIDKVSGTWNPFSGKKSEEAANWWKDYENQAALVERHEKFGTALSAGEQAAWKNATIAPGMKPETIAHNLKERARIANEMFNRTRGAYIKAGHSGVEPAFEERPMAPTTSAPKKVSSIAEAQALPPGTRFVDPNGVERVR